MNEFFLAVNVGNSNVSLGAFRGETLVWNAKVSADAPPTTMLAALKESEGFPAFALSGSACAVASVKRDATPAALETARAFTERAPVLLGRDKTVPVVNLTRRPEQTGIDRLLNVLAAWRRCAATALVVDLGSAASLSLVSDTGAFLGGAIAPGLPLAARALHDFTDALPLVTPPTSPPALPGLTSEEAIAAGLYYGYLGSIRELVGRFSTLHSPRPTIIGTGGDAGHFAAAGLFDHVIPNLTLEGIRLAYYA